MVLSGRTNIFKTPTRLNFLKLNLSPDIGSLNDLSPLYYNTPLELIEKSNKYLEKLGFSKKTVIDSTNPIFTEKESLLLEELINNQGKILTFEKCSEILWEDESFEKFSLEAIAKVIENIRKKIRELGINKEVIFTKRGSGCFLR